MEKSSESLLKDLEAKMASVAATEGKVVIENTIVDGVFTNYCGIPKDEIDLANRMFDGDVNFNDFDKLSSVTENVLKLPMNEQLHFVHWLLENYSLSEKSEKTSNIEKFLDRKAFYKHRDVFMTLADDDGYYYKDGHHVKFKETDNRANAIAKFEEELNIKIVEDDNYIFYENGEAIETFFVGDFINNCEKEKEKYDTTSEIVNAKSAMKAIFLENDDKYGLNLMASILDGIDINNKSELFGITDKVLALPMNDQLRFIFSLLDNKLSLDDSFKLKDPPWQDLERNLSIRKELLPGGIFYNESSDEDIKKKKILNSNVESFLAQKVFDKHRSILLKVFSDDANDAFDSILRDLEK